MIELLLLEKYVQFRKFKGKEINIKKYISRLIELREEFLEPYVIDSTSKE